MTRDQLLFMCRQERTALSKKVTLLFESMISPLCSEGQWLKLWEDLPMWAVPERPLLVVSPHPDDETLALGGLLAAHRSLRRDVTLLAVTDGENAYSGCPALGAIRSLEQERAAARLGIPNTRIMRAHLPDSGLENFEDIVTEKIISLTSPNTLLVAPWSEDFHPDHKVCGRAAEQIARDFHVPLLSYLFWTWHTKEVANLLALPLRKFPLNEKCMEAKAQALAEHQSQLYWPGRDPILTKPLLWPAKQNVEVFLPYLS